VPCTSRRKFNRQNGIVILPPVAWSKESLKITPRTFDVFNMISGARIDERDKVILGEVWVT
jgi:hypothetical protein